MTRRFTRWDHLTLWGRNTLGVWPGLLTFVLLLVVVLIGGSLLLRVSLGASAQSPSSALAQLATRVPLHTPYPLLIQYSNLTITPTATQRATQAPTHTATQTATPRPPTPTWTPPATATQIAASPLLTQSTILTQAVPLPASLTGPQMAPAETITATDGATPTQSITPAAPPMTDMAILLLPTPTPSPTHTITEALAQPVEASGPAGGLAGIVATATASAPSVEQPANQTSIDSASQLPAAIEASANVDPAAAAPEVSAPLPAPTVVSVPTSDGNVRRVRVPVLMYHYLSIPPDNADIYRRDLSVAPDLFAAHLDAMQQAGYTTISLYTLLDHLTYGAPLPEKPVVLTFDDGYVDQYTNAFPLLRQRGMTATFFIVTDFIHDKRPEYVSWEMVREMYAGGMSIEAHGRNHISLANKDWDYLIWQALGSYESIEVEIGVRPHFVSYPAGEYDQTTIDVFRSANYWAGFTTQQGATHSSDDLFRMRRIRIRGTTSPEELLRLLALDW